MTTPVAPAAVDGAKGKTKAKQRYLKAKRDRRKKRKSTTVPGGRAKAGEAEGDSEDEEAEDGNLNEGDVVGKGQAINVAEDEELGGNVEEVAVDEKAKRKREKTEKKEQKRKARAEAVIAVDEIPVKLNEDLPRPRKRRKLSLSPDPASSQAAPPSTHPHHSPSKSSSRSPPPSHIQSSPSRKAQRIRTPSPPPPSSIPSFPLPTQPNAPLKSELASQGLDRALARAQLVDPSISTPLSFEEDEGDKDAQTGLTLKTRSRLKELGIEELFAVQTTLLPLLLPSGPFKRSLYLPYDPPQDICVSAPTGSGKTLAYVLPIIETLSVRIVTRLRALIVLPTRDLVTQVRETFEAIGKGRGLKIGTATGQHSFAHEQNQLVADKSAHLQGGSSKVDVLICTPGRLIDHLNGTPNFSLQHLRFLVIDEADRLLAQSFQDWLAQVLAATRPPPVPTHEQPPASASASGSFTVPQENDIDIPYPDALSPSFLHLLRSPSVATATSSSHPPTVQSDTSHGPVITDIDTPRESSCQKLLFSATLMSDPGKIKALELRDAKYIVVQGQAKAHIGEAVGERQSEAIEGDGGGRAGGEGEGVLGVVMERFSMPATLTEHMLVVPSSQKPLMLFHLVHAHNVKNALVFTKSAESTGRLVKLFQFFERARIQAQSQLSMDVDGARQDAREVVVKAYSSDLGAAERRALLEKLRDGTIDILVCSDLVSRGIDISTVQHVVSYDAPVDIRKYVHRVGRTARAGREGDAWTLVEEQEARYFKEMMKTAGHLEKVKRLRVSDKLLEGIVPFYETALKQLKEVYARDRS